MSTENTSAKISAHLEAEAALRPAMAAMRLVGLLQGAEQSGLLALLRTPALTAELAAATGIAEERVIDICRALDAHAVVIQTEGRYHLADP